jgi:hypothetical protein
VWRFVGGAVSGILSLLARAGAAPRNRAGPLIIAQIKTIRWAPVTPLFGLGRLAVPAVAQDQAGAL